MTSKNLFSKLLKEDLKRRIWTIALSIIVFFLAFPVACALMLGNYTNFSSTDWTNMHKELLNYMQPTPVIILITVTGAIICGLSGYFYLHSKSKVDLYHSIPVRRELMFIVNYINGILIYLIPYIVSILLCFIVIQVNGFMSAEIFSAALGSIGLNLLYYCLIYTVVIIADMLTGNFVVNCLGTAVFLLYGPSIVLLKELYFSYFYKTYYAGMDSDWKVRFLSPIGSYINISDKVASDTGGPVFGNIILVLAVMLLFLAFAIFLYRKRPSEAAGKAMAFGISKPIIKFLLVIPITLGGGMVFRNIASRGEDGWFIFGLLFTLFLSYAVIEIIYNFDIRSAFRFKKQLLACAGITAVIACIFGFDLFRYDDYIPKKDNIESMSVAVSGLDDSIRYYEMGSGIPKYVGSTTYQLKHMKLKDFDSAYELAQSGVRYVTDDTIESYEDKFQFFIKYETKNGRKVYRTYSLNKDTALALMSDVYAKPEFKAAHYPIDQIKAEEIGKVTCNNLKDNMDISLDVKEKEELLGLYREELNSMTLDDLVQNYPIAAITFTLSNENYDRNFYSGEYYVYPAFVKTAAFLKSHGFDPEQQLVSEDVRQISINNYNALLNKDVTDKMNVNVDYTTMEKGLKTISYNKQEQIREIYNNLISSDYYFNNRSILKVYENIDVYVEFRLDEYGNSASQSYYFKKGNIPEFVKEDILFTEE